MNIHIEYFITKGIRIFGSKEKFKEWLHTANQAPGGKKPIDLIKDPYRLWNRNSRLCH
jgi:uncharacterized protein (DUF2384 family)